MREKSALRPCFAKPLGCRSHGRAPNLPQQALRPADLLCQRAAGCSSALCPELRCGQAAAETLLQRLPQEIKGTNPETPAFTTDALSWQKGSGSSAALPAVSLQVSPFNHTPVSPGSLSAHCYAPVLLGEPAPPAPCSSASKAYRCLVTSAWSLVVAMLPAAL